MSTDFSRLIEHLGAELHRHAAAEFTNPVLRAVFLARGGHAPGQTCALAKQVTANSMGCPWCGEQMYGGAGPDGLCINGHEWWDEGREREQ